MQARPSFCTGPEVHGRQISDVEKYPIFSFSQAGGGSWRQAVKCSRLTNSSIYLQNGVSLSLSPRNYRVAPKKGGLLFWDQYRGLNQIEDFENVFHLV